MKVLLTAPPTSLRLPLLAIYQLASVLREQGHSVLILDPMLHDAKVPEIDDNGLPTDQFINTMYSKLIEGDKDIKDIKGVSYKKERELIRNEDRPPLTVSEMEEIFSLSAIEVASPSNRRALILPLVAFALIFGDVG